MVAAARAARVDVVLMTIPPQRDKGASPLVQPFNDRIRSIAGRRGAVLVDVHRLLLNGPCTGLQHLPCMGRDGLHPTEQGFRLIAEELQRVLVARYEVEILVATAVHPGDTAAASRPPDREAVSHRRLGG